MQLGSKSIEVTFEDGNKLQTSVQGTRKEIREYYVGQYFQFGDTVDCPHDKMVKAVKVEFLEG